MAKKLLAIMCALAMVLSLGTAVAESERPAAGVVEGVSYVSDHLPSASALYVSGESVTFDNAYFYGAGYASDAQINAQLPNQYGMCSVVLGVGNGTDITLNNPTIVSDPESYANGVFAAGMAKITVNGGTISTDNSSGHGIDATFMAHVYANDVTITTKGETSGALATDFGGGFISGERLICSTESGSSPGIFCAGSTVMLLKECSFTTKTATGIVVAHDHAVVVLDNCEVNAAGTAVSGLQALPSAASSDGSAFYAFGGKLTSRGGAIVGESGGKTEVNLIGVECSGTSAIQAAGSSVGILTVNLWDTELVGDISCSSSCIVTVNIYAGGKLTGEVKSEGEVTINVYDGGEYVGSYEANQAGEGEAAPVLGTFDDYLVSNWASGSQTWTASRGNEYVTTIEPTIIENSAASFVKEGAAAQAFDLATFNPSEGGIDPSQLNVGGAYGFSVTEVFGGGEGDSSGESAGDSSGDSSGAPADFGDSSGDSSGAPADSSGAPAGGQ